MYSLLHPAVKRSFGSFTTCARNQLLPSARRGRTGPKANAAFLKEVFIQKLVLKEKSMRSALHKLCLVTAVQVLLGQLSSAGP